MYNVYQHEQKIKEEKKQILNEKHSKSSDQTRDILTARFKDRINESLLKLSKDAEKLPKAHRPQTAGRQRSWLKTSGSTSDQERVKASESWNNWLDTVPSNKHSFNLRPRDKSKEIQSYTKFRAKSGHERLEEAILQQKECFDSSAAPDSKARSLYKNFYGLEKPNFSGGREVMKYYHVKTYFKTIEGVALDLHASVRNTTKAEVKRKHIDEKLGMSENVAKNEVFVQQEMCKEEVIPISCGVLERFGIWETRKTGEVKQQRTRFSTPKWATVKNKGEQGNMENV